MDFHRTVLLVALVILIITLIVIGTFYKKITDAGYPYTQDICPKLWTMDGSGNCLNPSCTESDKSKCNALEAGGSWANTANTPGYITVASNGGFNPNDSSWENYNSASSTICGKKSWSLENKVDWNGISTYNPC